MNKRFTTVQNNVLREKLPSLPNFLQKLWVILNSEGFEKVIRWDESGESFRIVDSQAFCNDVLPNFFKHCNINSFVRQLNLYGFRKVSSVVNKHSFAENSDNLHFANQFFIRGKYHLLHNIKRNAAATKQKSAQPTGIKTPTTAGKNVTLPEEDLICLLQELKIVRERQSSMKNTITQLTRDNILLWQEMAALRSSYHKQKENVGKLVQFLMGLGQSQNRMSHSQPQRIVQLEELDNNTVHLNFNSNLSQSSSSNCLAIQQNTPRFAALDCNILDGLQQELDESGEPNTMTLDIETALLEGLQLRQRAIEEGAPFLDNGILSSEDQFQAIDRPMSLRNEERLRYYENAGGIHLNKRPFQRRILSPGSPSDFYPKRALYSNTKNQELVPTSSRGRIPIRRDINEQTLLGRANLQLAHSSGFIHHDASSPNDEAEEMQFFVDEQTGQQMMFEDEFPNEEEDQEFVWQEDFVNNEDADFSLLDDDQLEEQEGEEEPVEHHVPPKRN